MALKTAMKREHSMHKYYLDLSCKTEIKPLVRFFELLFIEELKPEEILNLALHNDLKVTFGDLSNLGNIAISETIDPNEKIYEMKEAFRYAIKKETEASIMYKEFADSAVEPELKILFLRLASVEDGHAQFIQREFDKLYG